MTEEEKELLIKDLCTRLPYSGVRPDVISLVTDFNNGLLKLDEIDNETY